MKFFPQEPEYDSVEHPPKDRFFPQIEHLRSSIVPDSSHKRRNSLETLTVTTSDAGSTLPSLVRKSAYSS